MISWCTGDAIDATQREKDTLTHGQLLKTFPFFITKSFLNLGVRSMKMHLMNTNPDSINWQLLVGVISETRRNVANDEFLNVLYFVMLSRLSVDA